MSGTLARGGARPVGSRRRRQLCSARGVRGGLWRGRRQDGVGGAPPPWSSRGSPGAAVGRARRRRLCRGHGDLQRGGVFARTGARPRSSGPGDGRGDRLVRGGTDRPSRVPSRRDRPAARGAAQRERAVGSERRQRGLGPPARGAAGRGRRQPVDARCDRRWRAPSSRSAQPGIVDALRRRRSPGAPQPARHRLASRRHQSPGGVALRPGDVARARAC